MLGKAFTQVFAVIGFILRTWLEQNKSTLRKKLEVGKQVKGNKQGHSWILYYVIYLYYLVVQPLAPSKVCAIVCRFQK